MADRLIGSILAVAAVLAVSPSMPAQTAVQPNTAGAATIPRTADGKPDLSGVWGQGDIKWSLNGGVAGRKPRVMPKGPPPEAPSMTPWATEIFNRNKGTLEQDGNGNQQRDPSRWAFSPGPTRLLLTTQRPFEVVQFEDQVMLLFENDHAVRRIYTDGRGHPEGYPVTFMGHSIGKWEGDTLVADTVSIDPRLWVNSKGYPQSDQMRFVERFRRVDPETLEIEITFHDPKAYTKPWTRKQSFELYPPGQEFEIMEYLVGEEWLEVGKTRSPKATKYRAYPGGGLD
jgi:hypothetical protein